MNQVDELLRMARRAGASDLHLSVGLPPTVRHNGVLKRGKYQALTAEDIENMVRSMLPPSEYEKLVANKELDFAYVSPDAGRCRSCACFHHNGLNVVFRLIPEGIPALEDLGFPDIVTKLLEYRQGMILVTGQAGCGKSTTLAAMIQFLNQRRHDHIICLEDPIEFLHKSDKCHIIQREVGHHTNSFERALRACLREDPDVIMVGEMRDLETIRMAITAAETGHLVLATLHTMSAPRTITRILDVFPPNQQDQIRTMLSESLRGIISQQLVPTADEKGRTVAMEILVCTPAIANLIRDDRTFQIPSHMQVGVKLGMRLMDDSLIQLLQRNLITLTTAIENAQEPNKFRNLEDLKKDQINWDAYKRLPSDKEKRRILQEKGVVLVDRKTHQARPVRKDSVSFRFYQEQHGRLPEDEIYSEILRLFPEAGRAIEEAAGLPGA